MFAFSKDALDLIGQGTVKKSKMTAESTETISPQTSSADAEQIFIDAAKATSETFNAVASVDAVAPAGDDDVFFVSNALALPLALKYALKETARVLVVEPTEIRVKATVAALKESSKDLAVAVALPFLFNGPQKITVASAILLAGLLSKRKNLIPFTHVIVNNVTSFTIGMQVLIGQLRRLVNTPGAKGHHRIMLCGDVKVGLDIIKPVFNKLKVSGMSADSAVASPFVTIDAAAAFFNKKLVKIPANNSKTPFPAFTSFALDIAKDILAWCKKNVTVEGAVVVLGDEKISLEGAELPCVSIAEASSTQGLFAVLANTAEAIAAAGIKPVAVIDLGVSTVRGCDSPAESLLQDPRTEFASTVEISERKGLAANHPYFGLYPANVTRPLRSFDAVLSAADRNELLQATRGGLDFRCFIAPVRESAFNEALTSFSELGLIRSKEEPVQTFLGEIVARLSSLSVEMGTFVAIATALGLGDVAAAIAAANAVDFYKDIDQKVSLRSKYDPDDSNTSDVLADGVVFLTESEHTNLCTSSIATANVIQSEISRTLANYQPPMEKRTIAEQRSALLKSAALLAYLLSASFATSACRISGGQGEFANIRSTARVKTPASGSIVSFPTSGAMATAASLTKEGTGEIQFSAVTLVSTGHFNAAQLLLRPVVHHSSSADTVKDGENIVRFAVSSNGLSNNYYVPVEAANRVIEARAALCTSLGLLMLRRLTTPHATSTEDFVAAIRRKRRDFAYVVHIEETARKLEQLVQQTPVQYVITTFVNKQASVLCPTEVGVLETGTSVAVATDTIAFSSFFDKLGKKVDDTDKTENEGSANDEESAAAGADEKRDAALDELIVSAVIDDDDDYFTKNGPIMDDDDE